MNKPAKGKGPSGGPPSTQEAKSSRDAILRLVTETLKPMLREHDPGGETWQRAAGRLLPGDNNPEAEDAWVHIEPTSSETVLAVVDLTRSALERAKAEVHRPPAKEETDAIERVRRLAAQLAQAVNDTMPAGRAYPVTFKAHGRSPELNVWLGWHDLGHWRPGSHVLEVVDVLQAVQDLAHAHLQGLPPRAVTKRKGEEPERSAFVRWLSWLFLDEFKVNKPTAVAHITSAVFDDLEPVDARHVDKVMATAPAAFKTPRYRGDEAG